MTYTYRPPIRPEPEPMAAAFVQAYQLDGPEAEELAEHLRERLSPSADPWSARQMQLLDDLAAALDDRAEIAYGLAPVLR